MQTIIKKIDENCIDQEIMNEAGELLKSGALVAFPTETVYGLGANALDEEAAKLEELQKIIEGRFKILSYTEGEIKSQTLLNNSFVTIISRW